MLQWSPEETLISGGTAIKPATPKSSIPNLFRREAKDNGGGDDDPIDVIVEILNPNDNFKHELDNLQGKPKRAKAGHNTKVTRARGRRRGVSPVLLAVFGAALLLALVYWYFL